MSVSTYPKEIFLSLSEERQVQIFLDLLHLVEHKWENCDLRTKLLSIADSYLDFCAESHLNSPLNRLMHLRPLLRNPSSTLRQVLNLTVPLERWSHQNFESSDEVRVSTQDCSVVERNVQPLYVILDHVRSAFNVGSIFRTSECLGVEQIFLVGYTPTPEDQGVQKTAMGTSEIVKWSQHNNMIEIISDLRARGVYIAALETAQPSTPLDDFQAPSPLALVLGNERFGLESSVLKMVDEIVRIPMMGVKNSLNVATSFGMVAFEVERQWRRSRGAH